MPPNARHLLARNEVLDAVDVRSSASPENDARASTTWHLQPPSASLVLWRKLRNPPSTGACVPRSRSGRHICRPARAPVPAALHRCPLHGPSATAPPRQLYVDTRRPCTCNQRPSTRSHRTVDNSLITARSEYCSFLNLPLDECFVNTPPVTREVKSEKKSKRVKNSSK